MAINSAILPCAFNFISYPKLGIISIFAMAQMRMNRPPILSTPRISAFPLRILAKSFRRPPHHRLYIRAQAVKPLTATTGNEGSSVTAIRDGLLSQSSTATCPAGLLGVPRSNEFCFAKKKLIVWFDGISDEEKLSIGSKSDRSMTFEPSW